MRFEGLHSREKNSLMKILFWICLIIEAAAALVLVYRALQRYSNKADGIYVPPGDVAKILRPASLLALVCIAGLVLYYGFHLTWMAVLIVCSPVLAMGVFFLAMMLAAIFGKGRWN